jgi:hypothetical protein
MVRRQTAWSSSNVTGTSTRATSGPLTPIPLVPSLSTATTSALCATSRPAWSKARRVGEDDPP